MKKNIFLFFILLNNTFFAGSYNSLVNAIRKNDKTKFDQFINEEVDVNKRKWGVTPLYIAVHFERDGMIEPLIKKGAQLDDVMGSKKRTALHKAVSKGNETIVRILINAGADVQKANKNGKTPLAEAEEHGYEHIIQLLNGSDSTKSVV